MPQTQRPLEPMAIFAKNFFQHPKMLGSLIPSSRFLIRRLLGEMDFANARVIVEYGPGVGTITRHMLKHMRADAVLIAIDTNPEFVRYLRRSLPDPRLRVVHGSAANVKAALAAAGVEHADYVISGIPFSTIPQPARGEILRATRSVLRPEGTFLVYQFSPKVHDYLAEVFPRIERGFEPLNVLPAQLFFCSPTAAA
jgi:phospholipid N-methyltransferase